MGENYTEAWKRLFRENCQNWEPHEIQRFYNIPNDPEEVDREEYESCRELVEEINAKKKGAPR